MLARMREAAEQAKIRLSTEERDAVIACPSSRRFSFSLHAARAELEDLTRDIILRTRPHCLRSLADAKLEPKDLDQVILVGGQTRMPLVRRIVGGDFRLRGI
jgi:molecular chaperone DnaK